MQSHLFSPYIRQRSMSSTNPIAGIIHIRKARHSTAMHTQSTHDMTYATQHEAWEISVTADSPFTSTMQNVWYAEQIRQTLGFTHRYEQPSIMEIWNSRIPAESRNAIIAEFLDSLNNANGQDTIKRTFSVPTPNGTRWFEWRGQIIRDINNKPIRIAGSLIEIAEYTHS
jgi:hypothetical protein